MRLFLYLATGGFLISCLFAYWAYQQVYGYALNSEKGEIELFIGPDIENIDQLEQLLGNSLNSASSFQRISKWMKFKKPKVGHYVLGKDLKNVELVRILRGGLQVPVKISFVKERERNELAGVLCTKLLADSSEFVSLLEDEQKIEELGFTSDELLGMFIPNTYEMWWTTNAEALLNKLADEYKLFWNESRLAKAKKIGLSPKEVSALASIVEEETNRNDEKSRVAGVYLNRLRKSWPLEADPTLKFALGDFSIKRVLNIHKDIESPYNTYKRQGLPPGPICTPSISSLDAVLNAEQHRYMFFCARADFSGYHNFAVTLREHNINARNYQDALNRLNIK